MVVLSKKHSRNDDFFYYFVVQNTLFFTTTLYYTILQIVPNISYSFCFESIQIVTGPSFTRATFMSAPNTPVCIGFPNI